MHVFLLRIPPKYVCDRFGNHTGMEKHHLQVPAPFLVTKQFTLVQNLLKDSLSQKSKERKKKRKL